MLGFLTLVALLFAVAQGGWSWAVFGLLFILWLAKRDQAKNQVETATRTETDVDPLVTVSEDWPPDLVDACLTLSSPSYYVGDLIPETKRQAAMAAYPPPGDGEILALIDCSVFGSVKEGLAIGRHGLGWHNWLEEPVQIQMAWCDLARSRISSSDSGVSVGSARFDNIGSDIADNEVVILLRRLRDYARSVSPAESWSAAVSKTKSRERTVSSKPVINAEPAVPINSARFEELLTLPGIGAAEAQMIIKRRSERAFTSAVDLVDYLDLKPHIATRLEGLIDFGQLSKQAKQDAVPQKSSGTSRAAPLSGRTID